MSRKFLVPIVLPADPTAALEAATKQYVDGKVVGGGTSEVEISASDPIGTNAAAELWYDTVAVAPGLLPASYPCGHVASVAAPVADQTGITTTVTDITGLTVTFTADSTRRYKTTFRVWGVKTGGAGGYAYDICDGANGMIARIQVSAMALNDGPVTMASIIESGLSGSTTRKMRALTSATTLTVLGTTFWQRGMLLVEDIGGV